MHGFEYVHSFASFVGLHRVLGTDPVRLFDSIRRASNTGIDPRESGMVPVKLFEFSSNCVNITNPPISDGMVPVKPFPNNRMVAIFVSFPISVGRLPLSLLSPKFKKKTSVRLPMDDDMLPVRALSLRSSILSCVIAYNEAGILPTMFLLVSTNRFDNTLIFDMNDGMVPPKEFLPRFKYDSFVRLSIDEDITSPSRRFWLRSRYVSLVSP